MQSEDEAAAYPEDSYWYRPGFSAPHKSSSSLLRTCRLAYTEGQQVFLPNMQQIEVQKVAPPAQPARLSSRNSPRKQRTPSRKMDEAWLRFFKGSPGLRVLKVEYETLSSKQAEMMHIVTRNKSWKLPVRREGGAFQGNEVEGYLSAEGTVLKQSKWKGTSKLGGQEWAHHGSGEEVEYVVVTDTWRFVDVDCGLEFV
ncbi:hypothetical protein M7I_6476 [Glarea lozoyensis 74030]|uniref:Uncharacterized protein n=1 Tax=Glarea lozoyensis (strain ATCC 74030 / MF5533) TaxID=1104152 RepID=H0EUN9_GLAL7|nr:hypothetical protein M7I_6476 [Glarea lozoyensis 74030]